MFLVNCGGGRDFRLAGMTQGRPATRDPEAARSGRRAPPPGPSARPGPSRGRYPRHAARHRGCGLQDAVAGGHLHFGGRGVPVLGRVGQRLGDRVIGGEAAITSTAPRGRRQGSLRARETSLDHLNHVTPVHGGGPRLGGVRSKMRRSDPGSGHPREAGGCGRCATPCPVRLAERTGAAGRRLPRPRPELVWLRHGHRHRGHRRGGPAGVRPGGCGCSPPWCGRWPPQC